MHICLLSISAGSTTVLYRYWLASSGFSRPFYASTPTQLTLSVGWEEVILPSGISGKSQTQTPVN